MPLKLHPLFQERRYRCKGKKQSRQKNEVWLIVKIPSSIITMLVGIALTLISLWYGQNNGLMPVAASKEAELVDGLFNAMMVISTGLFLLVEGALVVAVIRFRRRPGDETDGPHLEGNVPLEILWTAIPAVIVLGISLYSFDIYTEMGGLDLMSHDHGSGGKAVQLASASSNGMAQGGMISGNHSNGTLISKAGLGEPPSMEGQAPDLTVNVTGLQYAFIFTYPDTGIVDGELHVPVGQLVKLNLQAQDVLHAFWLPQFRIKQDMIPGEDTSLIFEATKEGTYPVVCAELCGPYHGGMRTQLIVHSEAEYTSWLQAHLPQTPTSGQTANNPTETLLAQLPSQAKTSAQYLSHFVEPHHLPHHVMPDTAQPQASQKS
jgi:cytochrome c oxidase subunit II